MIIQRDLHGFTEDAKAAMAASPDYFVWWYTAKSMALVAALGTIAYLVGSRRR